MKSDWYASFTVLLEGEGRRGQGKRDCLSIHRTNHRPCAVLSSRDFGRNAMEKYRSSGAPVFSFIVFPQRNPVKRLFFVGSSPPLGVHCAVVAKVQTSCGAVCGSLELEEGTKGRQRKGCTMDSILRKV